MSNEVTVMQDALVPAEKPTAKVTTVQNLLSKMEDQFKKVLPKHITPDRLIRVAMTCIRNNKALLDCEQMSLISSIMTCAQLGLEPDPILGQVYLVPFNCKEKDPKGGQDVWVKKCQAIPGYKGLITLARNSGEVQSIIAKEVYSKDEFEIDWSLEVPFRHKPYLGQDNGEIIFVWCLVRFKDGSIHWDYMTIGDVEKIRNKSQGYMQSLKYAKRDANGTITSLNSPWFTDFGEMAKKTVIRRVAKYLPMSVQKAAFLEDMADNGKLVKLDEEDGGFSVIGQYDPHTGEVYESEPVKAIAQQPAKAKPQKEEKQPLTIEENKQIGYSEPKQETVNVEPEVQAVQQKAPIVQQEPQKQAEAAPKAEPVKAMPPAPAGFADDEELFN